MRFNESSDNPPTITEIKRSSSYIFELGCPYNSPYNYRSKPNYRAAPGEARSVYFRAQVASSCSPCPQIKHHRLSVDRSISACVVWYENLNYEYNCMWSTLRTWHGTKRFVYYYHIIITFPLRIASTHIRHDTWRNHSRNISQDLQMYKIAWRIQYGDDVTSVIYHSKGISLSSQVVLASFCTFTLPASQIIWERRGTSTLQ